MFNRELSARCPNNTKCVFQIEDFCTSPKISSNSDDYMPTESSLMRYELDHIRDSEEEVCNRDDCASTKEVVNEFSKQKDKKKPTSWEKKLKQYICTLFTKFKFSLISRKEATKKLVTNTRNEMAKNFNSINRVIPKTMNKNKNKTFSVWFRASFHKSHGVFSELFAWFESVGNLIHSSESVTFE